MKLIEALAEKKYYVLLLLLFLYIITKTALIGVITVILIIFFVFYDFKSNAKKVGLINELKETALAIALALIFWFGLGLALGTSSPISAIASCSMVDSIGRGDLIVIKREPTYVADVINVKKEDIESLNKEEVEVIKEGSNERIKVKGSLFSYCSNFYGEICEEFSTNPELFREKRGKFGIGYGKCRRSAIEEPCVKWISYNGERYEINNNGDVLVYAPKKEDLFYSILGGAEIVHRASFKLVDERGREYYLTLGDNNNIFDFQFYSYVAGKKNSVVNEEQVKGKVLFNIPYLGYYKLFLVGNFNEDRLCSFPLER